MRMVSCLLAQVAPLVWLDAWLDNVMASIPELAVCYHRKGVVQGYELLKTEDIFLVKGLSKDGTSTFHPHVVQQNASSILRFLQNNCKQDPGTYWVMALALSMDSDVILVQPVLYPSDVLQLFKNAGEDHMHLFDLSAMSKSCPTRSESDQSSCGTLPSVRKCSKGRYTLPLAMLLYRLAHSFAHSQVWLEQYFLHASCSPQRTWCYSRGPNMFFIQNAADQGKCVNFFEKCLKFMDEQEHLVCATSTIYLTLRSVEMVDYYITTNSTHFLQSQKTDKNQRHAGCAIVCSRASRKGLAELPERAWTTSAVSVAGERCRWFKQVSPGAAVVRNSHQGC